uniref:FYVE, RhoGEF and PH domain containing 6 n=1 Tax=Xiphophorus couchianus TaxID=32473 RepID=A0A3B5MW70_9TELE
MEKPPVAPKPKFIPKQRPVLSSPVPKRDGLSPLYPGSPKKVKPALPPKPCLAKLLSPSESKPLIWKRTQQEPALETHQRVATLNSHNGISHSKKPDWDYIIPICLCSQENCACVKNKKLEQGEKDFESSHVVGKPEENQKTVPIPQGSQDNNRGKTNNTKSQVMNNSSSNDHIINHYEVNRTQNHNFDSYSLSTDNGVGPSPRSSSEGIESSAIHPDVCGPGQQAGSLGTEQTSALQPKRAPPVLRKPGFPVPWKPRRYVPAHQEKVENDRDETAVQEQWEASVKEVEVSTDGKGCSSLSVSEPGNENRPPVFLSARRACPPPVPPFRKKPLLSNHLNTPSPSMQTPSKDMRVEDLSRGSSIYEIELCVDGEVDKMQKKVVDDQVESNHLLFHTLLKQPELKDLPTTILPTEDKRMENKMPRKHRRNKSSLGLIQKKEILEGKGVNKLEDFEARQASTAPDGVSKDLMRRELPLTPDEKLSKKHAAAGNNKPSRSSTAKKKAKSFSTADCSRSEGQRGNTFKKMLELKLVKKTPPKTPAKPDRTNESTANDFIPEPHRDPYVQQNFPVFVGTDNNFHHSQTDVEQSVSPIYETIPLYDDIPQYENGWPRSPYDDEGIYELQDPYFSLVKNSEHYQTPTEYHSGQKKSKIQHIATEIMTSESDFREAVHKASRQNGKPVIEERHLNQILYYLPQLYELNQDLLKELEQRVANCSQVADIFLKKGPYLKMYSTYIREFDKNVALLVEQSKKNSAFGAVVKEFETSPRCANLAVKHYLLKPVQRIPQYQLLLTEYLKNLSVDSDDYKDTEAALSLVKEVANHANDIMKHGDNFQKLVQVQCRLNGNHEIVQPGRSFIKEGVLMKLSRKVMQPRMFFLLSDVLLYTTPVQSGQYKLKNMLSLAGMKVSKPSQEAYQNELNIESVERSFILSASSAAERDEWLKTISSAISEYTKKKISFISNNKPENLGESVDGPPLGSTAPIWIPDTRTTMCMICTCDFTLTWRRHHCRACGKVVCQACSSNKHGLAYLKKQSARVCDQCFDILQHKSEIASAATLSPGSKATVAFNRKHKRIPAALKEVSANTDNSSMSGYLQRIKHNKKQGKRLWFVIKDKVLYTYAASEDVAALESLPLLGFVLEVDSSQKQQFKLVHKNILHYIFRADDVQTAQRWIDTFKEAVVL